MTRSTGHFEALRLQPGTDLRRTLERRAARPGACAMAVVTCCGSLSSARLRPADATSGIGIDGPLEILSLTGTLSSSGVHLHMAVGDALGEAFGGHVLPGCVIRTTAEIVLLTLPGLRFRRERDPTTGWRELAIAPRRPK